MKLDPTANGSSPSNRRLCKLIPFLRDSVRVDTPYLSESNPESEKEKIASRATSPRLTRLWSTGRMLPVKFWPDLLDPFFSLTVVASSWDCLFIFGGDDNA